MRFDILDVGLRWTPISRSSFRNAPEATRQSAGGAGSAVRGRYAAEDVPRQWRMSPPQIFQSASVSVWLSVAAITCSNGGLTPVARMLEPDSPGVTVLFDAWSEHEVNVVAVSHGKSWQSALEREAEARRGNTQRLLTPRACHVRHDARANERDSTVEHLLDPSRERSITMNQADRCSICSRPGARRLQRWPRSRGARGQSGRDAAGGIARRPWSGSEGGLHDRGAAVAHTRFAASRWVDVLQL